MTETEWLECSDPQKMLEHQYEQALADKPGLLFHLVVWRRQLGRGRVSDRKLRLFACACCRRQWDDCSDCNREVIVVAEQFADGQASREELTRAAARATSPIAAWLKADPIAEQPSWLFTSWLALGETRERDAQLA